MIALLTTLAWAGDVDRLAIAARLLADGHTDRAAEVLDAAVPSRANATRLQTLEGRVAFARGRFQEAVEYLDLAVEDDDVEPVAWTTLAAARLELSDPDGALVALQALQQPDVAAWWTLTVRAQRQQDDPGAALNTLSLARAAFPSDVSLAEEHALVRITAGLHRTVMGTAVPDLVAANAPTEAYTRVLQALVDASAWYEVTRLAEEVRLAVPTSLPARLAAATACLELEDPACAAGWLTEAAAFDPTYAVQAAECHRRAGDLDRALHLNGAVVDPAAKARQRLGLLVEAGRTTEATGLDARLQRLGLLDDDAVAYALAYAHARTGGVERAEQLVSRLRDPGFLRQGTRLLESL